MNWLLDTNVVSEGVRDRPNPNVANWMSNIAQDDIAISLVTLAELTDGAVTARDEMKRRHLLEWLNDVIGRIFLDKTLSVTTDILIDWLRLSRKLAARRIRRDPADLLIAATARVHNLVLVTRNVRDFSDTGIVVYDPWNDQTHRMEPP